MNMKLEDTREIGASCSAHPLFGSQVKKRVSPKRDTEPRRCVYTNPPKYTNINSGSRASKEDKRNTNTYNSLQYCKAQQTKQWNMFEIE